MSNLNVVKKLSVAAGACLISLGTLSAEVQAQTIIDTTPLNSSTGPFGEPNFATFGQVVTVPGTDNVLTDFTFLINDFNFIDPDTIDFRGYVAQYNDVTNTLIPPVLYRSDPVSTTRQSVFETFTFNTGGLTLVPNSTYLLFVSASEEFDGIQGRGNLGLRDDNPYAGGGLYFNDNGSNFNALFTNPGNEIPSFDLAFRATFQPIPEPSSIFGFIAFGGLAGRTIFKQMRQKKSQN